MALRRHHLPYRLGAARGRSQARVLSANACATSSIIIPGNVIWLDVSCPWAKSGLMNRTASTPRSKRIHPYRDLGTTIIPQSGHPFSPTSIYVSPFHQHRSQTTRQPPETCEGSPPCPTRLESVTYPRTLHTTSSTGWGEVDTHLPQLAPKLKSQLQVGPSLG